MWTAQRRWTVLGIVGALLLIILAAGALPGYHAAKRWRARRLAAESTQLLASGKLIEAQLKAQAAFLMRPGEPDAVRAAARVQAALDLPNAVAFWQMLIAADKATLADRREYVQECLRFGLLAQGEAELQKLMAEAPADPANLWLLSQLTLGRGDAEHSVLFAAQAREKDPNNKRIQLFLAAMRFDSADPTVRDPARQSLWSLARETDPIALEAAAFLGHRKDLAPAQVTELIRLLENHAAAKTAQRLLALDLKLRLDPSRKAVLLKEMADRCRAASRDDVNQFAAWLNQRRDYVVSLEVLPLEQALTRRDSFILHMDALAGLDRWADVERVLAKPDLPLPGSILQAFRARVALQLKKREEAGFCWRRALQAAGDNPGELEFVAQYAAKNDEFETAVRAYQALTKAAANPLPVYVALSRLLQAHGTTAELRDVLGEMATRWPDNPSFRNDFAYLSLLLQRDVGQARQTALELFAQYPQLLPVRSTVALAYLRSAEPASALRVLTEASADWKQALPGNTAVYVAALKANGRTSQASALLNNLPADALRAEERMLVGAEGFRIKE